MNKEEQIELHEEVQEYLQHNNIYGLLGQLLQQLILEKPKNILDYLIDKLQTPQKFTLFVVGPPGLSINKIIEKALANSDRHFELFNCGEQITKTYKNLKQGDKQKFNSCQLVQEQSISAIIKQIEGFSSTDKNYIIEGFPKNLKQALVLQKRGIYAKNVLIINIDDHGLHQIISAKISFLNPTISSEQRNKLIEHAKIAHHIQLNQIKNFYKQYLQIDLSSNREQAYIIKELNKAFSIKAIQPLPRVTSQVLIMGAPFSGRTTLGKKIANHYNFIYISTNFLIAEEIRKDTIHGRKIKSQFIHNQLIDNFLIQKLIEERIAKKDCKMQGFVLQGYPKNKEQFDNIKNMKLAPTIIIAVDTPRQVSERRSNVDQNTFNTRFQNWLRLSKHIKESKEKIFWVDPLLNVGNLYEDVVHQFEKLFT